MYEGSGLVVSLCQLTCSHISKAAQGGVRWDGRGTQVHVARLRIGVAVRQHQYAHGGLRPWHSTIRDHTPIISLMSISEASVLSATLGFNCACLITGFASYINE